MGALLRFCCRFEVAHGSTLFLDEVGELPPEVQVKLLRVLQEKQVERLGSSKTITVDVRIIAATNPDLDKAVREKRFRDDLYYRLNVFPIRVPPLRERPDSIDSMQRYLWPGNVRELRNMVERAMILATGPRLYVSPPGVSSNSEAARLLLSNTDCEHLRKVLETTGWRVRGKDGAAEILGLKPTTFDSMMVRLGITRQQNDKVR